MAERTQELRDNFDDSMTPHSTASFRPVTDIHCHILPGLDDGSETLGQSLAMADIASAGGVGIVIATPHICAGADLPLSHRIEEAVVALQAAIDSRGIRLRVLPGAEVYPSVEVPEWVAAEHPITLAGSHKYILLDCPFTTAPVGLGQLVFQLQSLGVTPILAHPERSLPVQRKPQLLEEAVHAGLLLQLDAMSLLGKHGPAAASTTRILLRHRWVQFLASDAHSDRRRRPRLAEAVCVLAGLIGEVATRELTRVNPDRLINGDSIPTDPAEYRPRNGIGLLTSLFRGRQVC